MNICDAVQAVEGVCLEQHTHSLACASVNVRHNIHTKHPKPEHVGVSSHPDFIICRASQPACAVDVVAGVFVCVCVCCVWGVFVHDDVSDVRVVHLFYISKFSCVNIQYCMNARSICVRMLGLFVAECFACVCVLCFPL